MLTDIVSRVDEYEAANDARVAEGLQWSHGVATEIRTKTAAVKTLADLEALRDRITQHEATALDRHEQTIALTKAVALDLTAMVDEEIENWSTFAWGHPVYTEAQIAQWSTKHPEYARLRGTWASNTGRAQFDYGTYITVAERDAGLKDMGVWCKVQAVLARAEQNDGTDSQKATAVQRIVVIKQQLDKMRDIGIGYSPHEACFALSGAGTPPSDNKQHRLVLGWCLTNYCQAASLIGYHDPRFDAFLRRMEPMLFWTGSSNWAASFDDSALAVAVYLKDTAMYEEAKARFYHHLASQVYVKAIDGDKVSPLHKEDGQNPPLHAPPGTVNVSGTVSDWGYIQPDMTAKQNGVQIPDGSHTEDNRDYGHVQMAHGAHMHSCRTILAQGDELDKVAYDRVRAGFDNNAKRLLYNLKNNGKHLAPTPVSGVGGGDRFQGWWGAKVLFGADTPANVVEMLSRPEVTNYSASGANHMVAEPFADGTT